MRDRRDALELRSTNAEVRARLEAKGEYVSFSKGEASAGCFSTESWLMREYGNQSPSGAFQLYSDGQLLDFSADEAARLADYLYRSLGLAPTAPGGPRSRLSPLAARTG